MILEKRKVFNPNGDDNKKSVVNGQTTSLIQLNNIRYKDIKKIDEVMDGNFWLPQKMDMGSDKYCFYNELQEEERDVFETILSFLIFLDSIQTGNISSNLSGYFTASEIVAALTTQAYFEKIHASSYQYILQTIFDDEYKKNSIYSKFKTHTKLAERTLYIGHWYQDFQDNPNTETFLKALFANYILEGLYFYNSFIFFYSLAYRQMMIGTKDMIRKINTDENLHVSLYEKIIKHYIRENDLQDKYDDLVSMMKEAVEKEISFMQSIIGDKIFGITNSTIEEYTKYLAESRLKPFGLSLYPEAKNPYTHLKDISGEGRTTTKPNFFEANVGKYNMASAVNGWDDL